MSENIKDTRTGYQIRDEKIANLEAKIKAAQDICINYSRPLTSREGLAESVLYALK